MYENEAAHVRLGIEFLQAMTEEDYLLDPTFDVLDLERKLNEIQADVNRLISNLPVEAIDDDEEREQEYAGDFEDSEELEDEVVECEKLIAQANKLKQWQPCLLNLLRLLHPGSTAYPRMADSASGSSSSWRWQ